MGLVMKVMVFLVICWCILLQAQISTTHRYYVLKSQAQERNVLDLAHLIADLSASQLGLAKTMSDHINQNKE